MDFALAEEQEMLKKTARDFLADRCPKTLVRQMQKDEQGYPPELWQEMARLGWMGLVTSANTICKLAFGHETANAARAQIDPDIDGNGSGQSAAGATGDYAWIEELVERLRDYASGRPVEFDDFQNQFKGLSVRPQIEYVKNKKPEKPNEIQAITAATISSVEVVKILNKEIKKMSETFKEVG